MAGDTDKNLLGSELVRFNPVQGPFPDSNRHPAVKTLDTKRRIFEIFITDTISDFGGEMINKSEKVGGRSDVIQTISITQHFYRHSC
jgi:hypothetical protein